MRSEQVILKPYNIAGGEATRTQGKGKLVGLIIYEYICLSFVLIFFESVCFVFNGM